MKKFFRKILIFIGTLAGLILLLLILYLIRAKSAIKQMTPVETMQITKDVYAIKDNYVNMYLVKDGTDFIAVDAGNKKKVIKDGLKYLNIDPEKVTAVLLTHSDADHVGAISVFKKAKVYLPEDEEQLINGETGRFLFFGNKINVEDYLLLDDEIIHIGGIKVLPIPTPGHTPGATCYVINDKYLFTGDALSLKENRIDVFPTFINKNARRARKSMSKLTSLDNVQFIFTAHYGYTNDYAGAVSLWKEENE